MKILSLALLFSGMFLPTLNAQIEAVTVNGDTVLLFDNGQWSYKAIHRENLAVGNLSDVPLNPTAFIKPKTAKDNASGKNGAYALWYDAKKWERARTKSSGDVDIELNRKNSEGLFVTIFEQAEMPLASLKDVAIANAKNVSTEFKVVSEEMRTVNGKQVLCMKFNATSKGIKFTYLGYYYCYPGGTLQALAFTYESLFQEFEPDFSDLLNGLIINE